MLKPFILLLLIFASLNLPSLAGEDKFPTAKPANVERRHEELKHYTLQAGTVFLATNQTPLSTKYNQVGDAIEVRLMKDIWIDNQLVLTTQTKFFGSVAALEQPLHGRDGIISLKFHEAELPNGERMPILAKLVTPNKKGTLGGEVTEPTQYKLVRYEVWGLGMYNRAWKTGELALGKHTEAKAGEIFRVALETPLELVLPIDEEATAPQYTIQECNPKHP